MTTDPTNVVALGKGDFFAIDRRAWAKVVHFGMNASVAYLVLARGTLADMRSTSWSTNAIEQRTGIGRPRIKIAIEALKNAGLIRQTRGGTKPRYFLVPFHELAVGAAARLSQAERALMDRVGAGAWVPKVGRWDGDWAAAGTKPFDVALSLVERGLLKHNGNQHFRPVEQGASESADWVWLPNDLIDGAVGEAAPLERVRQSQRILALRLMIDLYHRQSLQVDGGVHWRTVRKPYERHRMGAQGAYVVWGFRAKSIEAFPSIYDPYQTGKRGEDGRDEGIDALFVAFDILEGAGVVEFVAHLVDSDSDEGAVIHPYATPDTGVPEERDIALYAHVAGQRLLSPEQAARVETMKLWLAPVKKHIPDVAMLGLARLRYRARTSATAAWYDPEDWIQWAQRYALIAEGEKPETASVQHQR